MLNIRSLGIVLCYSATLTALVYNVPSSTMKEVTISGNIAEVSRSFELRNVPNGFHTIVLNHLPDGNTVDEKSIQVTGLGAAEVISTVTQNQVVHRESDPEFIALNAQLDSVRKTLAAGVNALNLERSKATKRLASLDTYIQDVLSANAAKSAPLSLEKLSETLDYQEKALEQHNDKIASLDQKLTSTQACLSALQAMIDTLREYGYYKNTFSSVPSIPASYEKEIRSLPDTERTWELTTQTKELHININVPSTESKLVFNVEYMTSPAAWHAEYDIRLKTPTTTTTTTTSSTPAEYEMRIGLYATVAQSTHEDWSDVHLHLSTSEPEANIYPPSPPTRQALHYQPDVPQTMFQSLSSGNAMHSMHKRSYSGDVRLSSGESAFGSSGSVSIEGGSGSIGGSVIMADMTVSEVDMTGQSGTLGSTVTFSPPHTVNITSNHRTAQNMHMMRNMQYAQSAARPASPLPRSSASSRATRLFIKEVVVAPRVFTYAVPTTNAAGAHLKAWAAKFVETGRDSATTTTTTMPLLQSPHGRVFLSSTYTGTTTVPATLPHTPLRLNLGSDRNVHITSTYVLPRQGSQSEEKVGWFVNDKVKYKVEVVEYAFTVHSTHTAPHLVVLSEYLPHVSEEGIKVELLQPAMDTTVQLGDKSSSNQDVWSEEDFVAAVLAHPSMAKPDTAGGDEKMHVFLSKGSNNIVYAKWVQPDQTVKTGLKYRIIWPDGKNIDKQVHY